MTKQLHIDFILEQVDEQCDEQLFAVFIKLYDYDWTCIAEHVKTKHLPIGVRLNAQLGAEWFNQPEIMIRLRVDDKHVYEGIIEIDNRRPSGRAALFDDNFGKFWIQCAMDFEMEEDKQTRQCSSTQTETRLNHRFTQTMEKEFRDNCQNTEDFKIDFNQIELKLIPFIENLMEREDINTKNTATNANKICSFNVYPRMTNLTQIDHLIAEKRKELKRLEMRVNLMHKLVHVLDRRRRRTASNEEIEDPH